MPLHNVLRNMGKETAMDKAESTDIAETGAERPPGKPLDYRTLEAAALQYLGRYASSGANLRRVLERRVERHRLRHRVESPDAAALIARIVRECLENGYVDDQRYARDKAAVLWRAGRAKRYIESYLASKGIARDLANEAVDYAHKEAGGGDYEAAVTYAKKRKFGPFRRDLGEPLSTGQAAKQLAALARQGFSYAIARRIVEAATVGALADAP